MARDNFGDVLTDDPTAPGAADPTVVAAVQGSRAIEIPAPGPWGLLTLLVRLGGLGARRLASPAEPQ